MQRDGEAVLQTLTAVWCRMRHLRKYEKRGNDLEEVEHVSGTGMGTVRPPSGSSSLWGWVPQVTLRATQRLSIVGRLHRPAYQYETVYPRLKNHIVWTGGECVCRADTSVCPYIDIIAPLISRHDNTL